MKARDLIELLLRQDMDSHVCVRQSLSAAGEVVSSEIVRIEGAERYSAEGTVCILLDPEIRFTANLTSQ